MRAFSFLLGLLGGSPSASASLSALSQTIVFSKRLFIFLLSCAGTISPMFYLGPVAKWFSSSKIARLLLISQYLGAISAGGILSLCSFFDLRIDDKHPLELSVTGNPFQRSVSAVLNVGGCIVFYSAAASVLQTIIPFRSQCICACFHAVLEVSGGIHALASFSPDSHAQYLLAACLCGFGGISILSQNLLFLKPLGIRMNDLVLIAILRGLLSSVSMAFLLLM